MIGDVMREWDGKLKSSKENIYKISINISGFIDGEAELRIDGNDGSIFRENLTHDVNLELSSEYYSNCIYVIYKPCSVEKGRLRILCRFYNL
jgi:hypothetical protein